MPPWQGQARPRVGLALGGGSARGIAHVGVLRWLEAHRIPIDLVAGTSMGGLIGGSFATGMDSVEIEAMLAGIDWNTMFGASDFEFQNVRRKRDRHAYPSKLELGFKDGVKAPPSLNNGRQVDLLLARVAAPYFAIESFDELPTPLRVVAVDLITARAVVLGRGSLARALRATMSLPAVFPPVEIDGQVLVDGGALDNIPSGPVRQMGADRVVAVNVGDLDDLDEVDFSLFGLLGDTLSAMMRVNSLDSMAAADIAIDVALDDYGSLDWRRYEDLIREGYAAAEARRDELLPLAVGEAEWRRWLAARASARRTGLPSPAGLTIAGAGRLDQAVMRRALSSHVGRPLDLDALETDLTSLGGLDRYETLIWRLAPASVGTDLLVDALPKRHGPPFLFLGVSLENTTASEFRFGLAGRALAYDVLGSGAELRFDAAVGSDPSLAAAWYRSVGRSAVFIEPSAGIGSQMLSVIEDDRTVATYRQVRSWVGTDVGVNLGRLDDLRLGVRTGRLDASVRTGDPGLPDLGGAATVVDVRWSHDGQDSPTVPAHGSRTLTAVRYYFDAPSPDDAVTSRETKGVTQAEFRMSWVRPVTDDEKGRVFIVGAAGTSFDGAPLPTEQFALGGPLELGAFNQGEMRGDHMVLASGGYLHQIYRMPDFLGGPVFAGGWIETGKAFSEWSEVDYVAQGSAGLILDTLVGPVFLSVSVGTTGDWRTYVAIGHVFR